MSENTQLIICLVIFVASLVSYLLNKIPMWITAMGALVLLVVTGCLDMGTALSGLSGDQHRFDGFHVRRRRRPPRKTTFVDTLCTGVMKLDPRLLPQSLLRLSSHRCAAGPADPQPHGRLCHRLPPAGRTV